MAGPPLAPQTHIGRWPPIIKPPRPWPIEPNLTDYERERAVFSWATPRRALDGLPGGRGLNIAHEAVDRHAAGLRGGAVALRWVGRAGRTPGDHLRRSETPDQPFCEEGWRSGSVSAEIAARLSEHLFYDLEAPVARVCTAEVPIPYPKHFEDAALPQATTIAAAVRALIR